MVNFFRIALGARIGLTSAFFVRRNQYLSTDFRSSYNMNVPKRLSCSASQLPEIGTETSTTELGVEYSTLKLLEHVNLNIPEHKYALPFYFDLLGFGLDPRRADNVEKGSGTIWMNCGASQFHLPFGENAQKIPGSIGLLYNSLDPLKKRVQDMLSKGKEDNDLCFKEGVIGVDEITGREHVKLVDMYDNVFFAREKVEEVRVPGADLGLKQPLVSSSNEEQFGLLTSKYGREETECIGISYVEFLIPPNTASKIAEFYESVFDATVSVIDSGEGEQLAIIAFGKIDGNGRADQSIIFREKKGYEIPRYDGHHLAMYIGDNSKDFEQSFKHCETAGVVWVNPRFKDKAPNLTGAKIYKQYRLKDLLNIGNGKKIFELEHEMRSVEHQFWPGKK